MTDSRPMQTSFVSGIVDPALKARIDIDHYYDGVLTADNVDIKPQGGARVRAGLRYRHEALDLDARLIPFIFNRSDKYLLVLSNLKLQVLKDGVLQTNLNGSGNDWIVTPWTLAQADELDFTQSYNTAVFFHEDVQTQFLFRGGDDVTWTLGALAFEDIPEFDYNDGDSPAPTTHDVEITFNGVWAEGDHYKLELNNYETPEIVYSGSTDANERRIQEELLKLPPTGFRTAGITVTHSGGQVYQIEFSDDSADAYEPMTGYNVDTTASDITETTVTATGVSRREDCISATRGWPRCGAFYEGRLWMAGLKSLPQHELASVVNDLFSLRLGEGFDDEAIFQPIDTDQYNGILYLHPGRHLQVYTAGGEFYHPARPITPANSGRPRQTQYGSGDNKPTEVDGAALFITRSNKTLREFLFSDLEASYNANSLSLLAADPVLLAGVVDMASLSGSSTDEASYIYCVTADGNCGVLNTLRSQNVAAWSRYLTPGEAGEFKRVAVVDDEVYFLVERVINGASVAYIEQLDPDIRMDSAITGTQASSATITGLSHLEGATVRVLGDDLLLASETVSGGEITVDREVTSYQVGLDYNPDIISMPLNVDLGDGPLIGRTKAVDDVQVLVKDTNGLICAFDLSNDPGETDLDEQIDPQWIMDLQAMDSVPSTVSGNRKFNFAGHTEGDALIRIFQRDPLPFHILGFVAGITIGGS